MRRFPPGAMVTAAVTFSRCLYAQLAQQAVQEPAGFPTAPQQLPAAFKPPDGFPLPPPGNPSRRAAELGMKLTAGMEIMCSAKSRAERNGVSAVSAPQVCSAIHVNLPPCQICRHVYAKCIAAVRFRWVHGHFWRGNADLSHFVLKSSTCCVDMFIVDLPLIDPRYLAVNKPGALSKRCSV